MGNKVIYYIPGTLEEVLCVVKEIKAITGMEPVEIVTDDQQRIKFNKSDWKLLEIGDLSAENYISRNQS